MLENSAVAVLVRRIDSINSRSLCLDKRYQKRSRCRRHEIFSSSSSSRLALPCAILQHIHIIRLRVVLLWFDCHGSIHYFHGKATRTFGYELYCSLTSPEASTATMGSFTTSMDAPRLHVEGISIFVLRYDAHQ